MQGELLDTGGLFPGAKRIVNSSERKKQITVQKDMYRCPTLSSWDRYMKDKRHHFCTELLHLVYHICLVLHA